MTETTNRFLELAVPGVTNLKPYVPGKPISELERELGITDSVKLASNENPLGCSELAKAAIQAELAQVGLYPMAGVWSCVPRWRPSMALRPIGSPWQRFQ